MANTNRNARPRHVHLGERLEIVDRIRRGELDVEGAAWRCGVDADEIRRWLELHSNERPVTLEEVVQAPDVVRLSRRAQRLAELIATSESTIRTLHSMLRKENG
jgi:hypothetical protein